MTHPTITARSNSGHYTSEAIAIATSGRSRVGRLCLRQKAEFCRAWPRLRRLDRPSLRKFSCETACHS